MGLRTGIEADVARVAGELMTACESGDPSRLQTAVEQAVDELHGRPQNSCLKGELSDLLLGIVHNLDQILTAGESLDPRQKVQMKVCYDLLCHARGTALGTGGLRG